MAAFSYQHSPLVLGSFLVPNKLSSLLEDNTLHTTTFFAPLCPGDYLQEIPVPPQFHESTSSVDSTNAIPDHVLFTYSSSSTTDHRCVNVKHSSKDYSSSSMVANEHLDSGGGDQVVMPNMVRKREKMKNISKVARESRCRKQKISNAMLKSREGKKLNADHNSKAKKKVIKEAPTGYIHVRARRGQATDSHSLAERVRREKISERMRLLQSIVPGCDKITGKAQILDEIINYVQSLQNQVEFLVAKLTSVSPMLNDDFELDFDANAILSEKLCSLELPFPSLVQSSSIQLSPVAEPKPNLISFLPQQDQKFNILSQENGTLWEINDQRLKFVHQDAQFSNLSPFF